jgi:citronellol/citronellal dehydrogenase
MPDHADGDRRVAVVTGATRGIGRYVALSLAGLDIDVVVVGRTATASGLDSLPGSVDQTVAEIAAIGRGRALGIAANLTDEGDTQAIVDRTIEEWGRCDILINNAAYTSNGSMLDLPWNRWSRAFRVQVVAPHQLCQGFLPGMRERGAGRVVNVSTGAALSVKPGLGLYSTSKQAMERWAEFLDVELKAAGEAAIAVNTVRVNRLVATEGWRHMAATKGIELATGGSPDAIPVTTESVADAVVWTAEQPLSWSGHALDLDEIASLGGPTPVAYDASGAVIAQQAT